MTIAPAFENLAIAEYREAIRRGRVPSPELAACVGSMLLKYVMLRDARRGRGQPSTMFKRYLVFSWIEFQKAIGNTEDEAIRIAAGDDYDKVSGWFAESRYTDERMLVPACPRDRAGILSWLMARQEEAVGLVELAAEVGQLSKAEVSAAIETFKRTLAIAREIAESQ